LHLRGFAYPDYNTRLARTALAAGLTRPIVFHGYAPMADMVRLAAGYDLALSLEPPTPGNRELCLANKVFTYLLAGVPQLLSPTRAHLGLAAELGTAARICDFTRPHAMAAALDAWWADPAAVRSAREHAWRLGQSRYNWNAACDGLLAEVVRALPRP
jgi:hypothetical protein